MSHYNYADYLAIKIAGAALFLIVVAFIVGAAIGGMGGLVQGRVEGRHQALMETKLECRR